MPAEELYVGLMSGTSLDGIDAVLTDLGAALPRSIGQLHRPYSTALRTRLDALCRPGDNEIERLGELDIEIAETQAKATLELLQRTRVPASAIRAIGSHGQTLRHRPGRPHPFTLQIGDPNTLAERTGITTVADFRRRDLAAGGQGAPLVPAFHSLLFSDRHHHRVILNIGGIANITWLPAASASARLGFDTGPGNCLLDHWIQQQRGEGFDRDGAWAATGQVAPALLEQLLSDDYFALEPPKSTGPDYFNLEWLEAHPAIGGLPPRDVQASLAELTARSIAQALHRHCPGTEQLFVCGGGVHNLDLMRRLTRHLPGLEVGSTAQLGLDPDWVEATCFAWLAKRTLEGQPGNLPALTGATRPLVLGGVYPGR